jgi:hypothetical protein
MRNQNGTFSQYNGRTGQPSMVEEYEPEPPSNAKPIVKKSEFFYSD